MKVVKFRAKSLFKSEWWFGYYVYSKTEDKHYIVQDAIYDSKGFVSFAHFAEIDPKTLGQYTGLTDKNGVEIYEGDIAKIENWSTLFKVVFDEYYAKFTVEKIKHDGGRKIGYIPNCEIIGNVYENLELL